AGLLARTVTVKIRDADFTTRQASRTLPEPVSSDRAVYAVARELLAKLRATRRVPARLLGVALSQFLRDDAGGQLSLLSPEPTASHSPPLPPPPSPETEPARTLARVIDALRQRLGAGDAARGRSPEPWSGGAGAGAGG